MWDSWSASQWDLFFLDPNGKYIEHYNIYTWDYYKIYHSINTYIKKPPFHDPTIFVNAFEEDNPALKYFNNEEFQRIFTLVETESFDWDTQAELDNCAARIFEPLTSVSKSNLEKVGIDDYFEFSKLVKIEADKIFDFYLKVIEAMK